MALRTSQAHSPAPAAQNLAFSRDPPGSGASSTYFLKNCSVPWDSVLNVCGELLRDSGRVWNGDFLKHKFKLLPCFTHPPWEPPATQSECTDTGQSLKGTVGEMHGHPPVSRALTWPVCSRENGLTHVVVLYPPKAVPGHWALPPSPLP